jgi:dephospho-CoA kinase
MKTFGLTGGMGMGKSTAARVLRQMGVLVVDTDALAHQLVEPAQPALEEIRAVFGPQVIEDGRLKRDALAKIVFHNAQARSVLENILHPKIRTLWQSEVKAQQAKGTPMMAVDIPLLFETGSESEFDATVCVACTALTQMRRLKERGWSDENIRQRIQAQWPAEKKMALAAYVIWTEGSMDVYQLQWIAIIKQAGVGAINFRDCPKNR